MTHIVSVVGARPQFVKLAPIAAACGKLGSSVSHTTIHTGQHYDANMSDVFFEELAIPAPDIHLGVGSGSHAVQTAAMLEPLEREFERLRPDWVLAYGDTNSTVATALAAVKIHQPLAHLEAGLRSFNRRMPEEHNRVLTDHAADLLLCPSPTAMQNLAQEGLEERTRLVGDVMVDITLLVRNSLSEDELKSSVASRDGDFVLATIHRAENTDHPDRLAAIVAALNRLDVGVVLAAHPRLRARAAAAGIKLESSAITVVDPLPYRTMVAVICSARAIVTDSGGLQKEAYVLRTPCTTVRTETEWVETLHAGWNQLVEPEAITGELVLREPTPGSAGHPYGDGKAAPEVVRTLVNEEP